MLDARWPHTNKILQIHTIDVIVSLQLLTLPNYIQHDSKIIILTTVSIHFINQRIPVLLKDNKILSETSNLCVHNKNLWKTLCQSFMLLLKFGTKPKFLCEEIMQLIFIALAFHQCESWNLFTVEIRPSLTVHCSFFRK